MSATPFEIEDEIDDGDGRTVVRALVGLGSNLGDRRVWMSRALLHLKQIPRLRLVASSSLYETRPVGDVEEQPDFLNACALFETLLEPRQLMQELLNAEEMLGRERDVPGGPRTIDLDLLIYEGRIERSDWVVVPHPRMHERAFVLMPAAEVAPDLEHPVLDKSLAQLLEALGPVTGVVQRRKAGTWIRCP